MYLSKTSLWPAPYLRTLKRWHCPHSPASAAAIDRYLLLAGPTVVNLQQRVCCCGPMLEQTDGRRDGWAERRTDGRTLYRFIYPAPHTMGSANNVYVLCVYVSVIGPQLWYTADTGSTFGLNRNCIYLGSSQSYRAIKYSADHHLGTVLLSEPWLSGCVKGSALTASQMLTEETRP